MFHDKLDANVDNHLLCERGITSNPSDKIGMNGEINSPHKRMQHNV